MKSHKTLSTSLNQLLGKVLVVDDDVYNILMTGTILKKWDIPFETAINGLEAIEKLSIHKYDLLLLDLQMPLATGLDVANYLQREHSENRHIPIILCTTTLLDDIYLTNLKEAMVENYLFKPFDENELEQAIYEVLDKR